jgi:hypothetical protein
MDQHNIFRLDVSVQNLLIMNVTDRIEQVPHNERRALLGKRLAVLDDVVKLAALAQLQNRIKVTLVVEKTVNPRDVGMV